MLDGQIVTDTRPAGSGRGAAPRAGHSRLTPGGAA
jgi:hypothetical protein